MASQNLWGQKRSNVCSIISDASWENLFFLPYANNKGADQPAHLCSLISTFVVHCLDSIIPLVSISKILSLYLASVAVQAGLSLTWLHILKTSFFMTRLNYSNFDWQNCKTMTFYSKCFWQSRFQPSLYYEILIAVLHPSNWCELKILSLRISVRHHEALVTLLTVFSIHTSQPLQILIIWISTENFAYRNDPKFSDR